MLRRLDSCCSRVSIGDNFPASKEDGKGVYVSTRTMTKSGKYRALPKFGSHDFEKSDVMEEDIMGNETGLV